MCRPIESRDSLGGMGPAAAFFAGLQGSSDCMNNQKPKMMGHAPAWSTRGDVVFGADHMHMLSMAASPPALPSVSIPKNDMPTVPWGMDTSTNNLLDMGLPPHSYAPAPIPFEVKSETAVSQQNFDVQELQELLDLSTPDDPKIAKSNYVNLDEGFDGTEMSILYSFLVDAPEDKSEKTLEINDGILNLNVLSGFSVEGVLESLEPDYNEMVTSDRSEPHITRLKTGAKRVEVKSRRLCKSEGCLKRSRSNGLCISHGGGRRCAVDGCGKSSQGGNLCIRHGGGKRCSHEGCDKAAQSNFLCKAHGGGPRCLYSGCSRSSQGGGFCRSHGGGKRCMFDGCDKGTQRGDYCALHGGSRLCEVPGCMRNDRGGGLCATHGGGKRCTVDGCVKPCRRKDLCSAHLRQVDATAF
ncbi:uncharacterized protein PHALS_11699 [Plasmopara halstedii]|uniref:WRKY19-like zinc finger domain-containing protein n=1 Tax=Plasmopara halstedii TaxID=4781 RepID=A0A0P1AJF8_PLAHL|nr:uncharacterized protein PHALS_11699 [Plasmopara halstedii]CEG41348.1 hypothetical protein PHALS_11699 [Plasmopara halstedii]|eukprot:XP_024577717.1 hypothetical protein PHALS_11699 [Plasmopara halstedii]